MHQIARREKERDQTTSTAGRQKEGGRKSQKYMRGFKLSIDYRFRSGDDGGDLIIKTLTFDLLI